VALVRPLVFALGLALTAQAPAEDDAPYVEILQDLGAIDGPSEGAVGLPSWERVRIDLKVMNHLPFEVQDLVVEVKLVHATRDEGAIPGWSFKETVDDVVLAPTEESYIRLARPLPARRSSPRAEEIAYRVHIESYRVSPPDLETSLRLLRSSAASDQRAALDSYALGSGPKARRRSAARPLALTIAALPAAPTAPDALRMLFAVQALGSLHAAEHVPALLELPERLDKAAWGRAVLELATRMVAASAPREPRLQVLPSWARTQSALLKVRAEDALEEAVRDTLLRMGDAAVPALLLASHASPSEPARARARRLLHALGRSTVRSQLALRNREHRLQVVAALGRIGAPEPVPALAELLRDPDSRLRESVQATLLQIGAAAVTPLVDGLGVPGDEATVKTLEQLAERHGAAVVAAAKTYGVTPEPKESPRAMVARLRARLAEARRRNLEAEADQALAQGKEGEYGPALLRLNAVFEQDRAVYMSRAPAIADLYFDRAQALLTRGDYDAAGETARTGLSIAEHPRGRGLLLDAQIALIRGFTELGALEKADEVLGTVDLEIPSLALTQARGRLMVKKAAAALTRGDTGLARALVDKARLLKLEDPELQETHRRLLLNENLAVVLVMSLFAPAALLVVVLLVRRRLQRARMHRLTEAIDGDERGA
jgi:tetratricopeptide (TPR) repeat protein